MNGELVENVYLKNLVHLVLVTKYRRGVLNSNMLKRTEELIGETSEQMDCELIEFNGESDHIHILVNVHPKLAISNFVGKLKGKTSYFLRKEYWDKVKQKLWGKHFWGPSYCVVSVGGAPLDVVKNYIENQRVPTEEKHAKKSQAIHARRRATGLTRS